MFYKFCEQLKSESIETSPFRKKRDPHLPVQHCQCQDDVHTSLLLHLCLLLHNLVDDRPLVVEGVDDGDLQGEGEAGRQAGRHHWSQLWHWSRGEETKCWILMMCLLMKLLDTTTCRPRATLPSVVPRSSWVAAAGSAGRPPSRRSSPRPATTTSRWSSSTCSVLPPFAGKTVLLGQDLFLTK